jgi:hypothetical protein
MIKASAYEFASIIDKQIDALPEADYLQKAGRGKVLREELYPLSRLGLHFKQAGLEVEVVGYENSELPDGLISINGFRERSFEVQITYADYGHRESLRAELLVKQGFTPGAGPIQRTSRNAPIIATMQSVDIGEHIDRVTQAAITRFQDKASKSYTAGTVLLIAFDDVNFYGRSCWNHLLSEIEKIDVVPRNPFAEVYLFNGTTNELRRAAYPIS